MKEKKRYVKAYGNLIKSYFVIFLLAVVLCLVMVKVFDNMLRGEHEPFINDIVAILLGIFSSLLIAVMCNVTKDSKNYISDIEKDNKTLKEGLDNLKLISNMIKFNVKSKRNELEILIIYREIQLSKSLLVNNNLFDSISLVGMNSLFDNLSLSLLKVSNKKEFIDESKHLLSLIDNITKMIEEVIILNDDEKDAFLKEKERLDNLFNDKKNM